MSIVPFRSITHSMIRAGHAHIGRYAAIVCIMTIAADWYSGETIFGHSDTLYQKLVVIVEAQ